MELQLFEKNLGLVFHPCRLHVLDLILKHFMSSKFDSVSISPNIKYRFINQLISNYHDLIEQYLSNKPVIKSNKCGRNDYSKLDLLCKGYESYQDKTNLPAIRFSKIGPICYAQWN